jgi:glycogen debranching enzyme
VAGLVPACHPWETGADHSPRWDDWCPGGFDPARWYDRKGELLATVERSGGGDPLSNPAFVVAPAGLNALVAFNARELAGLTGDDRLAAAGDEVAAALEEQWDAEAVTWRDAGPRAGGSGRVRALDGLLPALVSDRPERVAAALAVALDDAAYGGRCGPAGVHRDEPAFAPRTYWRGPAWPPLTYLLWLAAGRAGDGAAAARLAAMAATGAAASGLAEYWDPDDGTGLGAVPQSWAGLALAMA